MESYLAIYYKEENSASCGNMDGLEGVTLSEIS